MINWESTEKLRCDRCTNYLSVFPIHSALNEISICGRCRPNDSVEDPIVYVRNVGYETLAEFLLFPCIYDKEGCLEKLEPRDVADHETICPFRTMYCMQPYCKWQGPCKSLHDHYINIHPNFLLRCQEFEMNFLGSYELYHLMEYEQEMFMLKRSYEESTEIFSCSVMCYFTADYTKRYDYKVVVTNEARDLSSTFPKKSTHSLEEANSTQIHHSSIVRNLKDPTTVILKITIRERQAMIREKKNDTEINMDLLKELECPRCSNYVAPPIYQCAEDHFVCVECKVLDKKCHSCNEVMVYTNTVLEKVVVHLTYPCKFEGCDYTAKAIEMNKHREVCLYKTQPCILQDYENCDWNGSLLNALRHIKKNHHDIFNVAHVNVKLTKEYLDSIEERCFVMKFDGHLFKLHYLYSANFFYWAMQLVGPPEDSSQYQYEIDIVDSSENKQRYCVRRVCVPLTKKKDAWLHTGRYINIPLNQIESLIIKDNFAYRVRLLK